ncbi:MAG: adenosylcobinamide-GDP ribazoletransferase [Lentisphaeria bacterium]|nr:adenosylcobinamide-GDP ribazoletransferase [Lentisphaeria bacterium]
MKIFEPVKMFLAAVSVLSRLPAGNFAMDEKRLGRSLSCFAWVGAFFGILLCGAALGVQAVFPPMVAALVLTLLPEVLTGGFHLDGLADTADGFLSARSRERKLEIMRDSRIGSMGVLALIGLLGMKFVCFLSLPAVLVPLAAGWMMLNGRCGMVYHIASSRYARPEGMGGIWFRQKKFWSIFWAFTGSGAVIWLLPAALPGAILVLIFALLWSWVCRRVIGGATGDTIGACEECSEMLSLLALTVIF